MSTVLDPPAPGRIAFAPEPPEARFAPPGANVDPDRSKSWWRRLAPIVLAHKRLVITGVGGSLITMLLQLAAPRILRIAVDTALVPAVDGDPLTIPGSVAPFAWFLVVVAAARFGIGYVYRYNLQRTSFAIEFDLRSIIYRHLSTMHFGFFDRVQSGQLISRANSDIRSVQMFLSFAPTVVMSIVMFFAAFGLMLQAHVGLALVAVSLMPGVYFTGTRMRSLMFPVSWIVSSRQADVATIVDENVSGTRVVKSFAQERSQILELTRAADRLQWAGFKQVDVQARYSPFIQNLPRLGLALVLLYGGWLAVEGHVTVGTILEFNAYVVMLQMPFMMLGFLMMMGQRAAASATRILEVLDEEPKIVNNPGAVDLVDPEGEVLFNHVTFAYGDGPDVLSDFRLNMKPGDTVALVGRTGSGKSTVARLLPRFYDTQGGSVLIDGHDVRDLTVESVRANIGLVLDEPFLFSETIRNNIAYGRPDATQEDIDAVAAAAGAKEFIERLPNGYDTEVGERGYTLSGGQRQRIAIARTLLVNPRILILDDATSSIDVHVEHEIHGALRTLMKGRTTLIIAHRLSTISLADRVVLMEEGKITADGTHAELMRTVPSYLEVLARAEEEWEESHKPPPDPEEAMPPRMRAMRKVMKARAESRDEVGGAGIPGAPMGGVQ